MVSADFQDTDPHLGRISTGAGTALSATERNYTMELQVSQVIFAGGRVISQIRSADFQRDSSYYAFRNAIDSIVSTVRQQFYLVQLDRALIGVQEESVNLLQSQLQDQQNRFEAGTVPRFNVLQAQVALSNQIPQLITARNNYRIAQLQLAKTLGLDFDPNRGDAAPLEVIGELTQIPRAMPLTQAIAVAKDNRPFLKQQKATVLSNRAQVSVARSGFFPQINATAAEAWQEFCPSPTIFAKPATATFLARRGIGRSGTGAQRMGRSNKHARFSSNPRSPSMMMCGRWNWKCNKPIPICNRAAS